MPGSPDLIWMYWPVEGHGVALQFNPVCHVRVTHYSQIITCTQTQILFSCCSFLGRTSSLCILSKCYFPWDHVQCYRTGVDLLRPLFYGEIFQPLWRVFSPAGFKTLFRCSMIKQGPLFEDEGDVKTAEPFHPGILCNGCMTSWSSNHIVSGQELVKCARESCTWVRIQLCVFPMEKVKGCI